jgi:hypothetical protein
MTPPGAGEFHRFRRRDITAERIGATISRSMMPEARGIILLAVIIDIVSPLQGRIR